MEAETAAMWPRNADSNQKLEGTKSEFSLEPLEGLWPCRHLDFGLAAFRTERE